MRKIDAIGQRARQEDTEYSFQALQDVKYLLRLVRAAYDVLQEIRPVSYNDKQQKLVDTYNRVLTEE